MIIKRKDGITIESHVVWHGDLMQSYYVAKRNGLEVSGSTIPVAIENLEKLEQRGKP